MSWSDRMLEHRTQHELREQRGIVAAFERGEMRGLMAPAKRISTHLSHVLLSDTRAFKLKRAVRRSFVDFSHIEQRRAACEAELVHNRHMAGPLCGAVLPVTRGPDRRYGIDGVGEIVDWIVVMRRFDETQQFDRLAERMAIDVETGDFAGAASYRGHGVRLLPPSADALRLGARAFA